MLWLLKKDTLMIVRDRRAAVYAILMPLILLAFFIYVASSTITVPISLIDQDQSNYSQMLVSKFSQAQHVIILSKNLEEAQRLFEKGDTIATVVIEKGFGQAVGKEGIGPVSIRYDNTLGVISPLAALEIEKPIFSFYAELLPKREIPPAYKSLVEPFLTTPTPEQILAYVSKSLKITETPIYKISGPRYGFLPEFLPLILMTIILFFSSFISPFLIIAEKRQGIIERLRTFRLPSHKMILSKIIVILGLIAVQSVLLVLATMYVYGFPLHNPLFVVAILLLMGWACASLSLFIALASKSSLQTIQLVIVVVALQMIFGSYIINPAILPGISQRIFMLFPSFDTFVALQQIILKGFAVPNLNYLLILFVFGVVFAALSIISLKWQPYRRGFIKRKS